jgi:Tfp pilus assembly protein PilF
MAAGEYEISLKHLDEAIAMDPSYLDARLGKVRVLRAMGLLDEAEQEARIAVRLAPEDPRVKDLQEELGR